MDLGVPGYRIIISHAEHINQEAVGFSLLDVWISAPTLDKQRRMGRIWLVSPIHYTVTFSPDLSATSHATMNSGSDVDIR